MMPRESSRDSWSGGESGEQTSDLEDDEVFYRSPKHAALGRKDRENIEKGQREPPAAERHLFGPTSPESLSNARKLQPGRTLTLGGKEAMSVRFALDGSLLAVTNTSGTVEIFRVSDGVLAHTLDPRLERERRPVTCARFRPWAPSDASKHVLLTADVHGDLRWWHATTGKCLGTLSEAGHQIYSVDYRPNGHSFASAGLDSKVRVYDETTRKLMQTLTDGDGRTTAGHSNRVFALKWHPDDPSLLFSAGWDNTIQMWDTRVSLSVRSMFGPQICGDALDVRGNAVLAGSWRPTNQLEMWDAGTGALIHTFAWPEDNSANECAQLYAAQFGKSSCQTMVAAGGSGTDEARLLNVATGEVLGRITGLQNAVYSLAFSPVESQLAFATKHDLHLVDLKKLAEKIYR